MNDMLNDDREDLRDDPDYDAQSILEVASSSEASERFSSTRVLIAKRRLAVRSIYLPFPPQQDLWDALDEACCGADDLRAAGLPQPIVTALGDSFMGKTSAVTRYTADVARSHRGSGTCPVVYTKVDTDGSVGSLASDILRGLGEKRPDALTAEKRWNRARQAIRDRGVSLLILDEFQRAGRRPTISPVIGGKLLDIADSGDCALAFVGKNSSEQVFRLCPDLKNRLDMPVRMTRLWWETDQQDFRRLADEFDQALVDTGITRIKSGLADTGTAQLLLEAANGCIGQFSRIIETAVLAITRDGQEVITMQDLSDAVGDWSIPNGRIGYNPFIKSGGNEPTNRTAELPGEVEPDDMEYNEIDR